MTGTVKPPLDFALRDFRVRASEAELDDLARRLAATRWPTPVSDEREGFGLGTSRPWLEALVAYWRDGFDWRTQEDWLAAKLPSQLARIRGLDVHFSRIRAEAPGNAAAMAGPRPLPLLLLHGWPSSYVEMHRLVEPLTRPAANGAPSAPAFDVVVASIPGHGFSGAPRDPRFGADEAADLLCTLMVDVLGYDRFGVHGGDRGAFVAAGLGHRHPAHVEGLHLSLPLGIPAPLEARPAAETAWLESSARWQAEEGGYSAIQSTRPRSLAYGLTDSPVGLAGWILEKFCAWSDCDGDPLNVFDRDELLTNVMIYWLSGSIGSSIQYYHAHRVAPPSAMRPVRIEVPTGVLLCAKETWRPPRSAVERKFPVVRWTEVDRGGHFAALEVPDVVVEELRAFFGGSSPPTQPRPVNA
ncbi:MAG: epoxide hydrolase [Deltaproteobacteria bacterium]|nr:epoxide hydrolase [Deltaproteobacteria bacterium]